MADGGLPAPQPAAPCAPPAQPAAPPAQQGPVPHMNWSHFNPEFAGMPDKDTEAHLLRTNDWIDTHAFQRMSKYKDFVLH